MRAIIPIVLFVASWFFFNSYNEKKMREVIVDLEKTKAILNIEFKGDELRKRKLQEQVGEILKSRKVDQKKLKQHFSSIVDGDRIEEIFQ